MKKHNCESCKFRTIYQNKPQSILGRIWKWHINWCPGWKAYISSLNLEDKRRIEEELLLQK